MRPRDAGPDEGRRPPATTKIGYRDLTVEAGLVSLLQRFERRIDRVRDELGMQPGQTPQQVLAELLRGVSSEAVVARRRRLRKLAALATASLLALTALVTVQSRMLWSRTETPAVVVEGATAEASPRGGTTAASGSPAPDTLPPTGPAVARDRGLMRTATIRLDRAGLPVRIESVDPQRVLAAFCDPAAGRPGLQPVGTVRTARDRVAGQFRDRTAGDTLHAIRIFLDPLSGRWFAGDGSRIDSAPSAEAELEWSFAAEGSPEMRLRVLRAEKKRRP